MKHFSIIKIKKIPVICNLPHASINIPKKYRSGFVISDDDLEREVRKMGDLYANELYSNLFENFGGIISNVSRLVVDLERFPEDEREEMAKVGMGVLYEKNEEGDRIRSIKKSDRDKFLGEIYYPYHKALSEAVEKCIHEFGKCLILDCHTFPSISRKYEPDQEKNRPDVCLGTDDFHTPEELRDELKKQFEKDGFSVRINSPFSGTIVPAGFYKKNKNVFSVMVEINRKLYMDEEKFSKIKNFRKFSTDFCGIIKKSCDYFFKDDEWK